MERVSRPKSYVLKGKEQRVGESNLKLAKWPGEEVSSGFFDWPRPRPRIEAFPPSSPLVSSSPLSSVT